MAFMQKGPQRRFGQLAELASGHGCGRRRQQAPPSAERDPASHHSLQDGAEHPIHSGPATEGRLGAVGARSRSSSQMACQSEGLSSLRVTTPPVSISSPAATSGDASFAPQMTLLREPLATPIRDATSAFCDALRPDHHRFSFSIPQLHHLVSERATPKGERCAV